MLVNGFPLRLATLSRMAVMLTAALIAPSAHAGPMTYEYTGVIDSGNAALGIAAGTPFSGAFTYDPSKSPIDYSYEGTTVYAYGKYLNPASTADGSGLSLRVGGVAVPNPGGVEVRVSEVEYPGQWGFGPSPSTTVSLSTTDVVGGPLKAGLNLTNPTRSVFGSLAPPATLDLADFPLAHLLIFSTRDQSVTAGGTIESLTVVTPELSSVILFGVAAACLAVKSRRGRRVEGRR